MSGMRQVLRKISKAAARFMDGRYGMDKLNSVLLWTGVILVAVAWIMPFLLAKFVLHLASYVLMCIAIFRALSHHTYKRYRENRRFLMLVDRIRDREHRYFECPRCHQPVRVPRGKGKIAITCPKCKEKFIKKT